MSDITIPPEVAEAVERLLNRYLVGGLTQSEEFSIGHALANAAINAWPDGTVSKFEWGKAFIILPLPPKNGDT